jgi:hypothetical protein
VRQDAADFVVEHPDELPSPRYFEPDEFFNGKAERVLLGQGRDVVGPVEIRDRLQVSLGLNQLLGAPMQQADMGIDARDGFTVQFEHEPQHAVCGGMLGAEIDGEVSEAGGLFWHHASDLSRHLNGDPREAGSLRLMACFKPRAVRLNYLRSHRPEPRKSVLENPATCRRSGYAARCRNSPG